MGPNRQPTATEKRRSLARKGSPSAQAPQRPRASRSRRGRRGQGGPALSRGRRPDCGEGGARHEPGEPPLPREHTKRTYQVDHNRPAGRASNLRRASRERKQTKGKHPAIPLKNRLCSLERAWVGARVERPSRPEAQREEKRTNFKYFNTSERSSK